MTDLIPIRLLARLEGLVVLVGATLVYFLFFLHLSGWHYALLFFAPDLFMLGYFINRRIGALIYNLGHTYVTSALVLGLAWLLESKGLLEVGLIWCAHIGFDRLFGYGLKYASGFKDTHLQKL